MSRVPNLRNRLKKLPRACWPAIIAAILAVLKAFESCLGNQGDMTDDDDDELDAAEEEEEDDDEEEGGW